MLLLVPAFLAPLAFTDVPGVRRPFQARAAVSATAPIYSITDYGAIGDGDPANADTNTQAFIHALLDSAGQNPGAVYVPMTAKGFVVNNGKIFPAASSVIRGEGSMGASQPAAQTSTILGYGPGDTITMRGMGCHVSNLVFREAVPGQMTLADAFIKCSGTTCTINDVYLASPNIGISLQLTPDSGGEFWIKDVLVEGSIRSAGILANAGNATVHCNHVIMSHWGGPQPPYGIVVTAAGELVVNNGTDIICCGSCLAIVPGLDGTKGQYVNCIVVSDSLFDSGNGQGCVYICPSNGGYVLTARFANTWTSTNGNDAGNGIGTSPTSGFMFDGAQSTPAMFTAIQDVSLINCCGKSFVNRCGLYARSVNALSVVNSTFGGNFHGIQIASGCGSLILNANKCGDYVPAYQATTGGNAIYGIYLEPTTTPFIVTSNICFGNGVGSILNMNAPNPQQVLALNLP